MRWLIAIIVLSTMSELLAPENFVTPKKKRISTSALKEDIGTLLGTLIIKENTAIAAGSSRQRYLIDKLHELLEQDQNSFFAKAVAQQLQAYGQALENLEQVMRECQQKMQYAFVRLQEATK